MIKKIVEATIYCGQSILGLFNWIGRLILKVGYWVLVIGIPVGIIWYLIGTASLYSQYSDKDDYRGAAAITGDQIDDPVTREQIRYLPQNWTQGESLWFYNITQGSNLLPYDFFIVLEQKDNKKRFRENSNIDKFRYLPQVPTRNNPDGLPVGMVKDHYNGQDYMGFNCAACHTSQINYKGVGIRIDGGPSASDMQSFLNALLASLEVTRTPPSEDPQKLDRFYEKVLDLGNYSSKTDIDVDLKKHIDRLKTYIHINEPVWPDEYKSDVAVKDRKTHYGFARLDAFGRIYNRVLQHIIDIDTISNVLKETSPDFFAAVKNKLDQLEELTDKTNIVVKALDVMSPDLNQLSEEERKNVLDSLRAAIYNPANAPVSYPYLWDIAQHDYVQWTGLVSNGNIGPLGRNVGQVIGVFATLDWQKKSVLTFSSKLGGQGSGRYKIDFKSSINKVNLRRVENQLRTLQSPEWPKGILPAINDKLKNEGENIFNEYCVACHKNIQRNDPTRRVVTHISELKSINTDPVLANNTLNYKGYSALLRNQYVDGALGKLVIEEKMPVASLVKFSTRNVVMEPDPDRLPIFRSVEWLWGILKSLKDNPVKKTAKQGNFNPATPKDPLAPLRAYKARSLNGIWATAPYLHNGSVPNLYELLLPKRLSSDLNIDENGEINEYRSDQFLVGSREFDPDNVGFISIGYEDAGFIFNTELRGNSNSGHEYAAGRTAQPNGKILKPLTRSEKMMLLEYLKSL
jgi:hypothetical protein